MRWIVLTVIACALWCVCESASPRQIGQIVEHFADEDEFPVSIIHFNDFHARFEETNTGSTSCKEGERCIGGYARVVTAVKHLQLVRKATNPIYLNAGDNFQGTLWYNIGRWNVTSYFLNMLPADAMTIGNHEFDHQVEGVVPFLETINSPILICNIDDSEEPTMQGKYEKSMIIDKYGRKIGIIGVMLATTNKIADTGKLRFFDESESVRSEAAVLKAQGVDIIIVLSHSGLDVDKIIARDGGPDIDVIVGGHSHTFMFTGDNPPGNMNPTDEYPAIVRSADDGHEVLIVQASAYTKLIGDLTVFFDAGGNLVRWEGSPVYLDDTVIPDPEIVAALQPWKQIIDQEGMREVGISKVQLSRSACSVAECNMGSFIADAYAYAMLPDAEAGDWTYAPIVVFAVGGIRTTLEKGSLSYADLVAVVPFENTLDTMDMLGEHLLLALEYSATKSWDEDRFNGANVVQISGMKLVIDVTRPIDSRVVSVEVLCRKCAVPEYNPLDPKEVYRVMVGSFMAGGGDSFDMFPDYGFNHKIGPVDIDAFSNYVERMSPIIVGTDGRLTIIT